ncbi:hypothetical protein [Aquimarina litoralis]|uniref:hypothetical protein n=1 Tax=Aquimarina litoralis TaxID=584605 RepID=UPI001C594B02|nr:hypothetical protein [Aquimarina litoralis]MBW1298736.1 hypothetical protein [Aquimarina litoralis]
MSIEDDILIQNFLKNTLSEEERQKILSKMEIDESFREKINFEKQLFLNLNDSEWSTSNAHELPEVKEYEDLIKSNTTQELKDTITKVNIEYQDIQKKRSKSSWIYAIAATIAILIGTYIFSLYNTTSYQELYANYLSISDLPSLVDRGKTNKQPLIEAQKLFENKKYKETLEILTKEINTIEKDKATVYLYISISQMELNQFEDAEKTFDLLINSKLLDAPKGTWYKALLFIKQNRIEKAKELLNEIAKSSTNYKSQEALQLLEEL